MVLADKSQLELEPGQGWTQPPIPEEPPVPPEPPGAELPPISADYPHQYEFEVDVQSWRIEGEAGTIFRRSGDQFNRGAASLAVDFNGLPGNLRIFVNDVTVPANTPVDFHLRLPDGCVPASVQPYMVEGEATAYRWTGAWYPGESYHPGQWDAVGFTVPADVTNPVGSLGLDFAVPLGCSGTVYVDTVGWPPGVTDDGTGGSGAGGSANPGAGGTGAGTGNPSGGSTSVGAGGGSATGTGGSGTTGGGQTTGGNPLSGDGANGGSAEAGGCACRTVPRSSGTTPLAALLVTVLALLRLRPWHLRLRPRQRSQSLRSRTAG
jgi:hypothetical protein